MVVVVSVVAVEVVVVVVVVEVVIFFERSAATGPHPPGRGHRFGPFLLQGP